MSHLPLQLVPAQGTVSSIILSVVTLIAMVLGLFIAFQAYSGYRRNVSRPMLFFALGVALLTGAPFLFSLIGTIAGQSPGVGSRIYTRWLLIATRFLQIGGLCCLLYSLHIRQ